MINRRQNNQYYVSVEGECEEWYLDHLRTLINSSNSQYTVSIIHKHCKPTEFVKQKTIPSNNNIVFHLEDTEQLPNNRVEFHNIISDLKNAESIIKKNTNSYKLCYSNISFELWLILHFTNKCSSCLSNSYYLKDINKYFKKQYKSLKEFKEEKNFKACIKNITLENVKDAINNSISLMNNVRINHTPKIFKGIQYYDFNPSITVQDFLCTVFNDCKIKY